MEIHYSLPEHWETNDLHLTVSDPASNTKLRFRTYLQIDRDDWDLYRQRPKNIYLKRYKIINTKLDIIRVRIREMIESKKKTLSHRNLARTIKGISMGNNHKYAQDSFLGFVEEYINSRKVFICYSTYKRYMVFFRLLQRFQGMVGKTLTVDDINYQFVGDFIHFGKDEEYSENTIFRSIHFVKTILNFIERKGLRTFVRELEIRRDSRRREVITISEDEIDRIRKCPVPAGLRTAKNWLLISCYTGQRVSDFMQFTTDKLIDVKGILCISFTQQKTKKEITLPLHPAVMDILRTNGGNFPVPLPPVVYNDQIREIARLAGLSCQIRAKKRIGHRVKAIITEKWNMITSHIGRRSFATNFYGTIPTSLLMEATGHSTEQMFLKYINRMDNARVVSLSGYFDQNYELNKGLTAI